MKRNQNATVGCQGACFSINADGRPKIRQFLSFLSLHAFAIPLSLLDLFRSYPFFLQLHSFLFHSNLSFLVSTMLSTLPLLAFLASASSPVFAASAGSFADGGNTLVSAMMVRELLGYLCDNPEEVRCFWETKKKFTS